MVKGIGLSSLAALVAIIGLVGLWSSPAGAQAVDPSEKIISFTVQGADVRETLRNLFKEVGVSYSIAPDVQGTITLQLVNVRFDTALQNVVRQVDATYRVEGGVYQIVRREVPGQLPSRNSDIRFVVPDSVAPVYPPVVTQDEKFLFILRGNTLFKVNKSDLKTVTIRKLGE